MFLVVSVDQSVILSTHRDPAIQGPHPLPSWTCSNWFSLDLAVQGPFTLIHYVTRTVRKAGVWHSTEMSSCLYYLLVANIVGLQTYMFRFKPRRYNGPLSQRSWFQPAPGCNEKRFEI